MRKRLLQMVSTGFLLSATVVALSILSGTMVSYAYDINVLNRQFHAEGCGHTWVEDPITGSQLNTTFDETRNQSLKLEFDQYTLQSLVYLNSSHLYTLRVQDSAGWAVYDLFLIGISDFTPVPEASTMLFLGLGLVGLAGLGRRLKK